MGPGIGGGRLDPVSSDAGERGATGFGSIGVSPIDIRRTDVRPEIGGSPPVRKQAEESSTRLDAAAGIREEASFFGPGNSRCFGFLHAPIGEPVAGLVICCPYQAEIHRNYRREVLLARRLAARGIAVQRFHYRGFGHSDGDSASATFDMMREDAISAAEQLVRATGTATVGFLGTRFGGLVAASAVAALGGHLTLWEPVVDPGNYFEEILRFRLVNEMKEDPSVAQSSAQLIEAMRRDGSVDVLGHTVDLTLYESSLDVGIDTLAGATSVLLVQIALGRALRGEYTSLVEAWTGRGLSVETRSIREREAWWISSDRWPIHEVHAPTAELIDVTEDWLLEQFGLVTRT